ncbi:MAG: hypothetical protein ACM3PZ_00230 [Bacillota bacterium]
MKKLNFFILLFVLMSISAVSQTKQQTKEEQQLRASIARFNAELNKVRGEISNRPISKAELIATRDSLQRRADDGSGLTLEMKDAFLKRIKILDAQIKNYHFNDNPWAYKSLLLKEKFLLDTIRDMNGMLNMFQKKSISEAMDDKVPVAISNCNKKRRLSSNEVVLDDAKTEAQAKIFSMAVTKMRESPVVVDSIMGYKGKVYNPTNTLYQIRIRNEKESVDSFDAILQPGQTVEAYLLPGKYTAVSYAYGQQIEKEYVFTVSNKTKLGFNAEILHWYVYPTRNVKSTIVWAN